MWHVKVGWFNDTLLSNDSNPIKKGYFFFLFFFLDAIQLTPPLGIEMCGITLGGEEMPFGPRAISILKNDFSALYP